MRIKEFKAKHREGGKVSKEEMDYLFDVLPILEEYYNEQEVLAQSERAEARPQPAKKRAHDGGLFPQKRKARAAPAPPTTQNMDSYASREAVSTQGTLRTRYIVATADPRGEEWIKASEALRETPRFDAECEKCSVAMVYVQSEAQLACPNCGIVRPHQEESGMTYDQEINCTQTPVFAYKRINHLIESIAQLQGKQSTVIPDEILNAVKAEFKKARIVSTADITPMKVRQYLKKLGYSKYYEHVGYICRLLGVKPPELSGELENQLKSMFLAIQAPFAKACPKNRSNFCSYSYVLHKLVQLLGHDDLLPYFPLLKSRSKLLQHDKIWECICNELHWEFIKSI